MNNKFCAAVLLLFSGLLVTAIGCTRYVKRIEAHRDITGDATVYYLEWAWYQSNKMFPGAVAAKRELICTSAFHLPHDATVTGICQ